MTGDTLYLEAIQRIGDTMDEAAAAGETDANAMSLATASGDGSVSVRVVLLKGLSPAGLVFYTNLESNKGQQLEANQSTAVCFHWKTIAKQVRVEGVATAVDDETADAYFATRDRGSQIGAWASDQSRTLSSRQELEDRIKAMEMRYANLDVPRPLHWSGFCVAPRLIEIWDGRAHRLHVRTRYENTGSEGWSKRLLYP